MSIDHIMPCRIGSRRSCGGEAATALSEISRSYVRAPRRLLVGGERHLRRQPPSCPYYFLLATLLSRQAVLERARDTDIYLDGLGVLLTTVYIYGLIFRSRARVLRMGIGSAAVLVLYALGIVGLVAVTHG